MNNAMRNIPNTDAKPTNARAKIALGTTSPNPSVVMVTTSIQTVSWPNILKEVKT